MTPTLHNASKVLLGSHGSSDFLASVFPADPASFPAGRAVRETTAGALSLALAGGSLVGVSMGKSLSDTKKTSVARSGNKIPMVLSGFAFLTKADLTFFTKRPGIAVAIEFTDTVLQGSESSSVAGDDENGYVITLELEDGVSTGTQVKTALDADEDTLALIETLISGTAGDAQDDFVEDDIDGPIAVIGQFVEVSDVDGRAVPTGLGTLTGAVYGSAALSGVTEVAVGDAEVIVPAAYLDMAGGF